MTDIKRIFPVARGARFLPLGAGAFAPSLMLRSERLRLPSRAERSAAALYEAAITAEAEQQWTCAAESYEAAVAVFAAHPEAQQLLARADTCRARLNAQAPAEANRAGESCEGERHDQY